MVRLRNVVMAALVATGLAGCSFSHPSIAHWSIFHCDSCDDFPTPAYGPNFSMMPGSYTGPSAPGSIDSAQPAATSPASSAMPGMTSPPGTTSPPAAPATPPSPPSA
jgi:hypothetical protein